MPKFRTSAQMFADKKRSLKKPGQPPMLSSKNPAPGQLTAKRPSKKILKPKDR